jgi:hypothetical protein
LINFLINKKNNTNKRKAKMSNFTKKSKDPYVGCKSNTIWPTGMKPPIAQYQRKITEIVYTCSITKRKFKPSQMPMEWFNQPQIQQFVKQGWEMTKEYVIQEPFKQPKYGENEELIEVFRLKRPYQKRGNLGAGFKSVGESIPTMPVQEFAPENAKPVTMEDYKNMEDMDDKLPREPGEEDDWDEQF